MRKEFITTWSREPIEVETEKMSIWKAKFFDVAKVLFKRKVSIIVPEDISFEDLRSFENLRTKVTIEVLPW